MSPQINDVAPDFGGQTTEGRTRFHHRIGRREVEWMALDDRMLRDIGQSCSEVGCAVRHDRPLDRAHDRRLP